MKMNPQDMDALERVVLAGMKLMYDPKTFEIFKTGMLNTQQPVPQRLASETVGLMKMLMEKSNNSIPKQIIAPAAAMLLMEMGKFVTEAGIEQVSGAQVQEATVLLMGMLKQVFAPGGAPQPAAPAQPPAGLMTQPAAAQGA